MLSSNMETMARNILRLVQILWTLLLTALIGNVISQNKNAAGSATAAVNFTMFVAVICWMTSIYGLVASRVERLARPIIQLPLDGAATLFTFIDAIVLAAKLRTVNCAELDPKALPEDYIVWGSEDNQKRCREIQASTAFMWFLLISFAASFFFTFKDFKRSGLGAGSVRSSRPSMVQIGV
jgi:hypothetical protein